MKLAATAVCLLMAGCGVAPLPDAAVDASSDAGEASRLDTGMDASRDAGRCPDACDDGIACTDDRCYARGCVHVPEHFSCGQDRFCSPTAGCAELSCGDDGDCPRSSEGCVRNIRCDAVRCTWDLLDGDGDGDPPAVCGGTDCDDSNPAAPGPEICNGLDDDCDGEIDGPGATDACGGEGRSCVAGACTCMAGETDCGSLGCRVLDFDSESCGACGMGCEGDATCVSGACRCTRGAIDCGGTCANLSTNVAHCGACDRVCVPGAACLSGLCECPTGYSDCTTHCADLLADPRHCGACASSCIEGVGCALGSCGARVAQLTGWQAADRMFYPTEDRLLQHPGGDESLGFGFFGFLDELPFTGIASTQGFFLARRSPAGVERWHRLISGPGLGYQLRSSDALEDIWLATAHHHPVDFGASTVPASALSVTVVRYAGSTGAPSWVRTFTPSSAMASSGPALYASAVGRTGDVVLAVGLDDSRATDFGGGLLGSGLTSTASVVVVLDSTGAHVASWLMASRVEVAQLAVAPDGTIVVAGYYRGSPTVGATTLPSSAGAPYVARYARNGTPVDAFGLSGGRRVSTIAVANDGDIVLATEDDLLARFSPTGTPRWRVASRPSGASVPFARAGRVRARSSGNLEIVGEQFGGYDLGTGPITARYFVAELASDGTLLRYRALDEPLVDARLDGSRTTLTGYFSRSMTVQDQTLTQPLHDGGIYYLELGP